MLRTTLFSRTAVAMAAAAVPPTSRVPYSGLKEVMTSHTSVENSGRLQDFRRFYELVSKTTELAPTPLGHGGCERILNNEQLHRTPWQASCVELRARPGSEADGSRVISYSKIDFAALRRRGGSGSSRFMNVDSGSSAAEADEDGQRRSSLEVVHYYETSSAAGLAGYQSIAQMVRRGLLPGRVENYSAEGGFGVWVVPHRTYVELLSTQGMLAE